MRNRLAPLTATNTLQKDIGSTRAHSRIATPRSSIPARMGLLRRYFSAALLVAAAATVCSGQGQGQRGSSQCRGKESGVFAHDQFCDYYYECEGGVAREVACPNGLAFSGKQRGLIQNCDYPHRVGCPSEDGATMGQGAVSTENCPWLYGVFAHATSCTRYWQCWNGTATIQQCPFSLLYNDALHSCDWPDNVPDCQKHPICKDQPNGHIPIEKSCGRFWLCVGGYPRLQRCPAGLAFSQTGLRCELANNVPGCEPPPPTPAPEGEEGEDGDRPPPPRRAAPRPPHVSSRPQQNGK